MSVIAIYHQSPSCPATLLPVTQRAIKRAAIFIFAAVNGTWALAAYLAHKVGVPPRAIVFLLGVGVVLGNLATYAGIKLGATALGKPSGHLFLAGFHVRRR
jgi:hypothetical protein